MEKNQDQSPRKSPSLVDTPLWRGSDMDISFFFKWISDIDIWDDGLVSLTVVDSSEIAMLNRSGGPRHLVPEFVALILVLNNSSW